MAAERTFDLGEFQNGYIIAWEVLTQCWNTLSVTITSGNEKIMSVEKKDHGTSLKVLVQNNTVLNIGDPVKLTIKVNEADELKASLNTGAINDQKARKLGYIYNVCIEDQNDDDYNDVYVNIVGWKNKG